jgi:hypothetical protein
MSKKHDRTRAALFANPVRANIGWRDVVALFMHLGADVTEGEGSRVWVALNGIRACFHEPHPEKEISKGAVRSVRDFLTEARAVPADGDGPQE